MEVSTKDEEEGRRRSSCCSSAPSSPEFEFWMPRNPSSFPEPDQLPSADKLFVDGVLLPLHVPLASEQSLVASQDEALPFPVRDATNIEEPSSSLLSTFENSVAASRRWRDILFKKTAGPSSKEDGKEKPRRKENKTKSGSGSSAAELNINIWPFTRSRSAGNGSTRPKPSPLGPARKVSSAPCSRSNSGVESKSRRLPRYAQGIYLGRSSPVWHIRRTGSSPTGIPTGKPANENPSDGDNTSKTKHKTKIFSLTVPMCIGYRNNGSCKADHTPTLFNGSSDVGVDTAGESSLSMRNVFGKKVH